MLDGVRPQSSRRHGPVAGGSGLLGRPHLTPSATHSPHSNASARLPQTVAPFRPSSSDNNALPSSFSPLPYAGARPCPDSVTPASLGFPGSRSDQTLTNSGALLSVHVCPPACDNTRAAPRQTGAAAPSQRTAAPPHRAGHDWP